MTRYEKIDEISQLMTHGLLDYQSTMKLLDEIEICWLVNKELLYFAVNHTVKILELE